MKRGTKNKNEKVTTFDKNYQEATGKLDIKKSFIKNCDKSKDLESSQLIFLFSSNTILD